MDPTPDRLLALSLAATAVGSFILAAVFDRMARGSEFGRSGRLLLLTGFSLSVGTLIVSTMALTGFTGLLGIFAAANRAILAGAGVIVAVRAYRRWRQRVP